MILLEVQDWLPSKMQQDIWEKKYRYKNETLDEFFVRVSGGNKEMEELIRSKKVCLAGRPLAGRGVNDRKVSFSNCYVLEPPEDSLESIFDVATKMARTYSYGGGCGTDLGKLAPRGAKVRNAAKESTGVCSFIDLYGKVTQTISQQGRRGALMISLPCDHPDIEEFIDLKLDLEKATAANISVRVSDDFMRAVENGEKWRLYFKREATGEEFVKYVDARKLFRKIAENNWRMGEPGILFWDRIKEWNMLSKHPEFEFAGTNPCVTGDTLVLTDKGYKRIDSLVGQKVNVWNGEEFSEVSPRITGENQQILTITFSDGSKLKCTPYHKFYLEDGRAVEAADLRVGDKLEKFEYPVIEGAKELEVDAYTQGFYCGDGVSYKGRKNRRNIFLYDAEQGLLNDLDYKSSSTTKDGRIVLELDKKYKNKNFVPDASYTIKTRLDWLAGLIDSYGTKNSEYDSIAISSVNLPFLRKVKYMLSTLGIYCTINKMKDAERKPMSDRKVGYKGYYRKESYRLYIDAYNVKKLMDLGLQTKRVELVATFTINRQKPIEVVGVVMQAEPAQRVYCFTEPKKHRGCFNGLVTGNCGELPLPANGACLLSAINLAEFVVNPFTANAYFDYDKLAYAARVLTRDMNRLLDDGIKRHPLKEQQECASQWRQIGVGIMGLADMFIRMGVEYGSDSSLELANLIMQRLMNEVVHESAMLAKEEGPYPKYNWDAISQTEFFKSLQPETREAVKKYGLRNSQLLTIAPTGSISTMFGVSGGAEPIYALSYTRKTESLHGEDTYYHVDTPIVEEYRQVTGNYGDLPSYFITAKDLDYRKRIKMQGTLQKYIDSSISSTVNLPNDATIDDVEEIYMLAWKNGLKGVTVFRDGCERVGILTEGTPNAEQELKRGEIVKTSDDLIGRKRKLITGCGSLHVQAFFDPKTGNLTETYLAKGSTGGCNNFMVGLSRMLSLACRAGVSVDDIADQLKSSGTCPSYAVRRATKNDTSVGSSCPAAIAYALLEMQKEAWAEMNRDEEEEQPNDADTSVKCPECGGKDLVRAEGCITCSMCGWSRCS